MKKTILKILLILSNIKMKRAIYMQNIILDILNESIRVKQEAIESQVNLIQKTVALLVISYSTVQLG